MKTHQRELKQQVLSLLLRSGGRTEAHYIADRIALPEGVILDDLLAELIAEGRLNRGFTLTANGKPAHTYSLRVTA
jgi:hypothetical protein